MKKTFKLSAEHILYAIAIANALRLAWAYSTADAAGEILSLPGLFGLVLGFAVSFGTAFISGKLGARLTKGRKVMTWSAFIFVLLLEPFILAPITMTHMSSGMSELMSPGFQWAWAVSLALVPSLVIAGVAVANGGLVEATAQPSQPSVSESLSSAGSGSAKSGVRSSKGNNRSAKISQPLKIYECPHTGAGCTVTKNTQEAINAHAGRCKFKPTIAMPVEQEVKA